MTTFDEQTGRPSIQKQSRMFVQTKDGRRLAQVDFDFLDFGYNHYKLHQLKLQPVGDQLDYTHESVVQTLDGCYIDIGLRGKKASDPPEPLPPQKEISNLKKELERKVKVIDELKLKLDYKNEELQSQSQAYQQLFKDHQENVETLSNLQNEAYQFQN